MNMWIIEALRWVRSQLKRVPGLQKAVQTIKKKTGLQTNPDNQWARIVMNQETDRLIRSLDWEHASTLEISGDKWVNFGFQHYRSVAFPDYDVCSDVLDEKFDIIIVEQVFEHLLWPYRAARNVFEMLIPMEPCSLARHFSLKFIIPRWIARDGRKSDFGICLQRVDLISIVLRLGHGVIGHASVRTGGNGQSIIPGCIPSKTNPSSLSAFGHWPGNRDVAPRTRRESAGNISSNPKRLGCSPHQKLLVINHLDFRSL